MREGERKGERGESCFQLKIESTLQTHYFVSKYFSGYLPRIRDLLLLIHTTTVTSKKASPIPKQQLTQSPNTKFLFPQKRSLYRNQFFKVLCYVWLLLPFNIKITSCFLSDIDFFPGDQFHWTVETSCFVWCLDLFLYSMYFLYMGLYSGRRSIFSKNMSQSMLCSSYGVASGDIHYQAIP